MNYSEKASKEFYNIKLTYVSKSMLIDILKSDLKHQLLDKKTKKVDPNYYYIVRELEQMIYSHEYLDLRHFYAKYEMIKKDTIYRNTLYCIKHSPGYIKLFEITDILEFIKYLGSHFGLYVSLEYVPNMRQYVWKLSSTDKCNNLVMAHAIDCDIINRLPASVRYKVLMDEVTDLLPKICIYYDRKEV